jgi:P-type Cu+ transporter
VFASPGQTFRLELDVHAEFGAAGNYRPWAQSRLADGNFITVPFTVQAR